MRILKTKHFGLLLALLFSTTLLFAQAEKGLKLIDKNKFAEAEIAIKKDLNDQKYKAIAEYAMARLYSAVSNPAFNADSAFSYISKSAKSYKKMDYKLKNKIRKKFSSSHIKKQKKAIVILAFTAAEETESIEAWNHFIDFYKKPGYKYEKKSAIARNEIAFKQAKEKGKWQDYATLIENYGPSFKKRSPTLFKKAEQSLLNKYIEEKSWDAFDEFAEKFPNNLYVRKNVTEELDSIVLLKNNALLYEFIGRYKNTVFANRGVDRLTETLPEYGSFLDCKTFLEKYKNHAGSPAVWERLYFTYSAKAKPTLESLQSFEQRFPDYPFPYQLQKERGKIADRMYKQVMDYSTLLGLKNFIKQFPEYDEIDSIWTKYYIMYRKAQPSLAGLERFEKHNPSFPFPEKLQENKTMLLDEMAEKALQSDDIYLHKAFVENYPSHKKTNLIWKKQYNQVKKEAKGWQILVDFKENNLNYPDKAQIDKDIQFFKKNEAELSYQNLNPNSTSDDYYNYLEKYPGSQHKTEIVGNIAKKAIKSDSKKALKKYLLTFPEGQQKKEIGQKLYQKIANTGDRKGILNFIETHPGIISENQIQEDLKKVKIKDYEVSVYNNDKKSIFKIYIKQHAPDNKAYRALRRMINPDLKNQNYTDAAKTMANFRNNFKNNNKEFSKLHTILTEEVQEIAALSIGDNVNTDSNSEFSPIISTDGKTLYLCRSPVLNYNEDIFISHKENGIWSLPVAVPEFSKGNSTAKIHEAPEALSADGNNLVFFKNGALYSSVKEEDGGWSKASPLSDAVNIKKWQSDARISADNKAIIFASGSGPSSYDIDIYVSLKDEKGKWGKAFSLGSTINTSLADRAPFLHPDLKTLYFSSKGHVGLGDYDIFISKRLDDTWTNWSEPVNMGRSINSSGSEFEFKVTTDGKKAYFTKRNIKKNHDIYIANLPEIYQPEKVTTISGSVKSIDGTPIGTEIVWEDLETGEVVQITSSDPVTGGFFATLPPKKGKFGYTIQHEGYFPLSGNIDITEKGEKNIVLEAPMILASIEEMKETGFTFELNNLFFETAKYDIKTTSYTELNRLVDWMKTYNLSIEILGHTDNVGENAANQLLSQNRANAVRNYLINKGCSPTSISSKGFGEIDPINTNETIKGRAKNRRVEIRLKQ